MIAPATATANMIFIDYETPDLATLSPCLPSPEA